jgi:Xaa-Pro aminopeptidase
MNDIDFAARLRALRSLLQENGYDGLIIPHGDEFQNEFVPESHQRLKYMTNFTGSAGFAVVLSDKAVVMSDGRYTIQLKKEIRADLFMIDDSTKVTIVDWLKKNATVPMVIGYDPFLHTKSSLDMLEKSLTGTVISLKETPTNFIDQIWRNRPAIKHGSIRSFSLQYAGISHHQKIKTIAALVAESDSDAVLLTLPDSVSWCLNLRANDVSHNPVLLARLLIHRHGKAVLFLESSRITDDLRDHLGTDISIADPQEIPHALQSLTTIWLDPVRSPAYFFTLADEYNVGVLAQKDPTIDLKAKKNSQEQNAMRSAHVRDGIAMIKFLYWLEQNKSRSDLSELSLANTLESFRQQSSLYKESSFDTICGWNENGAIIHYRATPEDFAKIPANGNGVLLLDSGAQYEDGTTDITRTISFGIVNPDIKKHFTLVLKGMIAISRARFPYGTTGAQIDVLARAALWDHGLDYAHGTGHGVGCFLSVHEEATSLSPRSQDKMEAGMIVSNEPGYYKEGSHGIRIENLILCTDTNETDELGRKILTFETLTLVPIDKRLIDTELLIDDEIIWLNEYHKRVLKEIGPALNQDELTWLQDACKAL